MRFGHACLAIALSLVAMDQTANVARADSPRERYKEWLEDQRERQEEARERWRERQEDERERYEEWREDEEERREEYYERLRQLQRRQPPAYGYPPPAYGYPPRYSYPPAYPPPYYPPYGGRVWFYWR
jgi:hypothetical protein